MDYHEVVSSLDMRSLMTPGKKFSGERPVMVQCPWHDDRKASLAVYFDHAHCYGCNRRQSVLEWVAERVGLDIERDFGSVVKAAADLAGKVDLSVPRRPAPAAAPRIPLAPLDAGMARRYHNQLDGKRAWYRSRGLSDQIIDDQLLGYNGHDAFTIPVWGAGGELKTIRFRRDDTVRQNGSKYWGIEGRNDDFLFNQVALRDNHDFVCICEGELDCLRLFQEGIPAVSSTNGAFGMLRLWKHTAPFFLCKRIFIVLDQDVSGRKAAKDLRRLINGGRRSATSHRAVVARWDRRLGKDVTELAEKVGMELVKQLIEGESHELQIM